MGMALRVPYLLAPTDSEPLISTVSVKTLGPCLPSCRLHSHGWSGTSDDLVFSDPAEVPDQPWECNLQDGSQGPSVFTETVLISGSLSVGASKYGTRNAIPITGGTVSGGFVGTVVPAGADFQLTSGGTTTLDARYLLESNDGEFLVVRNCGPFGALIPWFEARSTGP